MQLMYPDGFINQLMISKAVKKFGMVQNSRFYFLDRRRLLDNKITSYKEKVGGVGFPENPILTFFL